MNDKKDAEKLVNQVLLWWAENKYTTFMNGEDEENVYDEVPDFVQTAKEIVNKKKEI